MFLFLVFILHAHRVGSLSLEDRDGPPLVCPPGQVEKTVNTCTNEQKCRDIDTVGESGDPHARNLAGDKFDITRTGRHIALHVPRGAQGEELLLQVQLNVIERGSDVCERFFTNKILVQGALLGKAKSLQFSADAGFSVVVRGHTEPHKEALKKRWVFRERAVFENWASSKPFSSTLDASTSFEGRPLYILSLGEVTLRVELVQHKHFEFLNMEVQGLARITASIGGILGFDEYAPSNTPVMCKNRKTARLIQVES